MTLGNSQDVTKLDGTVIAPASTTTKYSPSIKIAGSDRFGLQLKAASSGDIDLLVELEVSNELPVTEEASDVNWSEPSGFSDLINLTGSGVWHKEVATPPFKYARLKITGQGTNHASTTVAGKIFLQGKR